MRAVQLLKQATSLANLEVQRSGYVPSPQDARHIQDMSQALSTELSNIEAEVALLQQLHRRISVQLGIHNLILSPIRRLPLELLSEIFAILYDREDETGGKMYMIIYVLSRVCSTWRVLVRATPRFWTRIPTVVFSVQHNVSFTHIHHIPDHISLSGTLPLCLTHVEPDNDELLKEFLDKFEPYMARIGHIDFDGSCAYFAAVGKDLRIPNAVEAGMALSGPLLPGTLDFLGNSPPLRTVELFHVYRDGVNYAPEFRFPALPALTWLTLEFRGIISTDAVLEALYACRNSLKHLSLHLYCAQGTCTARPVEFAALKYLHVGRGAYAVLVHLGTAKLDILQVSTELQPHGALTTMESAGHPLPVLSAFISRMPRPRRLQELRVGTMTRSTNSFASLLDIVDELQELHIRDDSDDGLLSEGWLACLTCGDDRNPRLPGLKKIRVSLDGRLRNKARVEFALERMLDSRKARQLCASGDVCT